jgi:hypothetical protein
MMGWFSLMQDTGKWSAEQRAAAIEEFSLYKTRLRPLIREADLYHVSARPDGLGWDGVEYFSKTRHRGVLYAFRGSAPGENTHRFALRGLEADRPYRISLTRDGDATGTADAGIATRSGRDLMESGIEVDLPEPDSSALVFIDAASLALTGHRRNRS